MSNTRLQRSALLPDKNRTAGDLIYHLFANFKGQRTFSVRIHPTSETHGPQMRVQCERTKCYKISNKDLITQVAGSKRVGSDDFIEFAADSQLQIPEKDSDLDELRKGNLAFFGFQFAGNPKAANYCYSYEEVNSSRNGDATGAYSAICSVDNFKLGIDTDE